MVKSRKKEKKNGMKEKQNKRYIHKGSDCTWEYIGHEWKQI